MGELEPSWQRDRRFAVSEPSRVGPGDPASGDMSSQQNTLQLGATFTPGGSDDFYLPEVISPAPQRVMPEVPGNMQENLARFEDGATGMRAPPDPNQSRGYFPGRGDSLSSAGPYPSVHPTSQQPPEINYDPTSAGPYAHAPPPPDKGYRQHDAAPSSYDVAPAPNFSPFPRLHNPPPNVPPSDEEKEATLEQARVHVLSSNDPEMQLAWAQDTLAYVEVSMQNEARLAEYGPGRPQTPQVEHQLREDAISVVRFLAQQNHPKAEFMRGMWLEFGKFGVRVDKKEAHRCYARAAAKGYARAEYRMGMQYESANDPPRAIKHYSRGVAMGDSASNYRLGMMVLLGQHGQPQDYRRGIEHIKFAADTADENAPQGAYVYGMLLARELENFSIPDQHLPMDLHEARAFIEKAAYLGFAKAQVKMGAAYELCQLGCDFNPALSLHYNALAARQGEAAAEMAVSKWFLCGYDSVFEKNEELAVVYAQRAARGGLPTAEFAMGYFYEVGVYVTANVDEAKRWYEKAAQHGNCDAVARIDGIARSKTLSKRDHEQTAIQRIRSQYGSQRGRRPARFRTPNEPLPSVPDGRLTMPEPSRMSTAPVRHQLQPSGAMPPRAQSAMGGAPYPLEDGLGRHGPHRPGTATGFVGPHGRAGSALGMAPQPRPSTAAIAGASPQSAVAPHARPIVAGADLQPPLNLDPLSISKGPRATSANMQAAALQGHPASAAHETRPNPAERPLPPRLDIGFSAPHDPALDRRNRLQKQQPGPGNRPTPPPPAEPHPGMPLGMTVDSPSSPRWSGRPQGHGLPAHVRPPSAQSLGAPPVTTRPPRSRPTSTDMPSVQEEASHAAASHEPPYQSAYPASHQPPYQAPHPTPQSAPQHPGTPSTPHRASQQSIHPDAVAPRPVGKGPKTFDEMGVPQATKESECVVM